MPDDIPLRVVFTFMLGRAVAFVGKRFYFKPPVYTHKIEPIRPATAPIATIQFLNEEGHLNSPLPQSQNKSHLKEALVQMIKLRTMDGLLYEAQRQGRISFYMTSTGEEAIHFGSVRAWHPADPIYAQYRETGVLLGRGFGLNELMAQVCGSWKDEGKGRQMPVHYGSTRLNFQTISSPLATQLPQSVGAAYFHKHQRTNAVPICYFGEGAASEGDFHAAMNMSATLKTPLIFFCRNNSFAISTPVHEQYAGDGVAARAPAYGMPAFRVDGNDLIAVWAVSEEARRMAVAEQTPVLIEAISWRVGHHSTSDDSSAYRKLDQARIKHHCPIKRLASFLQVSEEEIKIISEEHRQQVLKALEEAEKEQKPPISEMFTDVYDGPSLTPELTRQQSELMEHLAKDGVAYNLSDFKSDK